MRRVSFFDFILTLNLALLFPFCASQAVENRSRVEELYIWKISDEMKLSVPEEKAFSDLIRKLNQKKSKTNEKLQEVLKNLSKASSRKDKERFLSEHRKLLKEYNDYTLEEVDGIQKIFGMDKSAQYFILKNDLNSKLKSLLMIPEKSHQPTPEKLAPPVVVEEK